MFSFVLYGTYSLSLPLMGNCRIKTTYSEAQMFAHTICSCMERWCLGHAVMIHFVLFDPYCLCFLPYFYTEKQGKLCSNMANVNKKVYICECSLEYTSKCTQSWSVWSNCNKYIPIYYQIQPFNGHAIYKTKHTVYDYITFSNIH